MDHICVYPAAFRAPNFMLLLLLSSLQMGFEDEPGLVQEEPRPLHGYSHLQGCPPVLDLPTLQQLPERNLSPELLPLKQLPIITTGQSVTNKTERHAEFQ